MATQTVDITPQPRHPASVGQESVRVEAVSAMKAITDSLSKEDQLELLSTVHSAIMVSATSVGVGVRARQCHQSGQDIPNGWPPVALSRNISGM